MLSDAQWDRIAPLLPGKEGDPGRCERVRLRLLCADGYSCILWNSVPRDWEDPSGWAEAALQDCERQTWTLVVLHDLPNAAAERLDEFILGLERAGHEIVQEFPADCVPIRRGQIAGSLAGIVAA